MLKNNETTYHSSHSTVMLLVMVIAAVLPFFPSASNVYADKVVLDNGDTLSGTVVKLQEGKLTLKTDYAGSFQIEAAKIEFVVTDKPVEVHTTRGEVFKGTLKAVDSGKLTVEEKPDRKTIGIEWETVSAINPPPKGVWKGNVAIGGSLRSGNTDQAALSVGFSVMRRTEKDRFSLGFFFNYGEEEDEVTARNTHGTAKYDYFFSKQSYGYLGLELLNDKFQDIQMRTIVGPGLGYQVWEDPVKALAVEVGASYFSDNMRHGDDNDYITARFGLNFRYALLKFIIFTDSLAYYPSLEKFATYTLRNEAALTTPLVARWVLKLANILQYNSDPANGIGKTDNQWILGLQYLF